MKKTAILVALVMLCLFSLASCGDSVPVLTGEWEQINANSEDAYQIATITENSIEVYWYNSSSEVKSLYWAGTFVAPTASGEYAWDSSNDSEKTSSSLLASRDETKTFTYKDGEISYSVTALGVTQTVRLNKVEQ